MDNNYYIYIATNKLNSVFYTGVTNNLLNRANQHKEKIHKNSFTAKYNIDKIVYYEYYSNINDALEREKQIKASNRENKLKLIRNINPDWKDLLIESE
ncbi:MAG: GIY-YIG catalytic domain protein [Parcubacteria group bacterium GW2011_GWE2_38_18]|nr:MAG: GIY-YIG catalytic domain protein [Parcubacteria group bacterium GW2011_GWE2_38_18]